MVGVKLAGQQEAEDLAVVLVKVVVKMMEMMEMVVVVEMVVVEVVEVEVEGLRGQQRKILDEKAQVVVVEASV